jgi:prevent-host-death family protein
MLTTVGVRELKNRLSEYLRLVRAGERVIVTDRGRPIAELRPPGLPDQLPAFPGLVKRAARGDARIGAPNRSDLYPSVEPVGDGSLSRRLLDEQRGDR